MFLAWARTGSARRTNNTRTHPSPRITMRGLNNAVAGPVFIRRLNAALGQSGSRSQWTRTFTALAASAWSTGQENPIGPSVIHPPARVYDGARNTCSVALISYDPDLPRRTARSSGIAVTRNTTSERCARRPVGAMSLPEADHAWNDTARHRFIWREQGTKEV